MSVFHYIENKQNFDFEKLQNQIRQEVTAVLFEQRSDDLSYFWIDKTSTRGVDVSFENGLIELRNTGMSNDADYHLTNSLAKIICSLFQGTLYEEYEGDDDIDDDSLRLVPLELPVFSEEKIKKIQLEDTNILRVIITQQQLPIAVFGPIRKTHFGTSFMEGLKSKTLEELKTIMHLVIINGNYNIPNYEYGNIMEMGEGENKKIVKLLTNKENCIIDKYDYLLIANDQEKLIAITNDTLNTILPESWKRVDEYTIVAPIIPDSEFQKLVIKAEALNQFADLEKMKE